MKTGSQGITLNCSIDVSWNMLYWRSMKSITLKINGQTFKYEIKVQVLKCISWIKLCYLARFFCPKCSKQSQLLFTNRRLLFCLIVRKEEWHFIQLGEWKMDCAESESVAPTVYYWNWTMFAHIKRRWVSLHSVPPWDQGGMIFVSSARQEGQLLNFKSQGGDTFRGGRWF